jgi:hypothetical protein
LGCGLYQYGAREEGNHRLSDGLFHPDQTVTTGQAVTILLRMLGYKDENIGGIWPDSYMATGAAAGLTDGVGTNAMPR